MTLDPSMRASDDDRETVAGRLRDAHAEGRLTMAEFEERIDATYAAKTLGELAVVTRDLPAVSGVLEAPAASVPATTTPYARSRNLRGMWAPWGSAVMVCGGIWVTTSFFYGRFGYPWPLWVAVPWGAALLARTLFGADRERPGRQDGERDHL